MKLLLLTYGTRGDVEPFLALALGLQAAGHDVVVATSSRFRAFVEQRGVPFHAMSDESLALIESPEGRRMLEGGTGFVRRMAAGVRLSRRAGPINDRLMRQTWEAARAHAPDRIVYHSKLFAAPHVAEKLGVPAALAMLQPMMVPTREFPAMGLPSWPIPGWNRLSYRLVTLGFAAFRKRVNTVRREVLGLGGVKRAREVVFPPGAGTIPILHAYSRRVRPEPADWPAEAVVTGYWRLPEAPGFEPEPDLRAFLADGPPPVFVSFGSMTSADPSELGALVAGALRRAGCRGIVGSGWADLEVRTEGEVLAVSSVPYGWLFPRTAAVVHHGGAGTTAAGFHAGVPQVICPFFGDQPGWAALAHDRGVAVEPLPRKRLTEERLAAAIQRAVGDPGLRVAARGLADELAGENGVARAIEVLEAGG
ncbi:glycosyltransferase [Gemmatimonadota bacterium Y43]|uniref:glycosyltransferase n=1 Tax=Gaopeijia maritima TaxID=3119007 RepID=UPI00327689FB